MVQGKFNKSFHTILCRQKRKCVYLKKVVYYETIKRELKIKPISECRCDERVGGDDFITVE